MYVRTHKNLADEISPCVYSDLRDPVVIFHQSILSSSPKFVNADPAGNLDS